jgi:hypothetical protein
MDDPLAGLLNARGIQPDSERPFCGPSWLNPRESTGAGLEIGTVPTPPDVPLAAPPDGPFATREPPVDAVVFAGVETN